MSVTKHCIYLLQHGKISYRKYERDTIDAVANHIFNIGGLKIFFELVSARDS